MSAEKTLDILDLFDFHTTSLTVPQIADKLQQPTSSVYRHLRVLKEKGYINGQALQANTLNPFNVHRPGSTTGFSTNDNPMNISQINLA